jgi:hypothetical protein
MAAALRSICTEACTVMSCRACTNYPRVISVVTVVRLSDAPGSLDLITMVTTSGDYLSGVSKLKAPKWATKLPLEATELGAKSGNSLWCMPPHSESGRILLAGVLLDHASVHLPLPAPFTPMLDRGLIANPYPSRLTPSSGPATFMISSYRLGIAQPLTMGTKAGRHQSRFST